MATTVTSTIKPGGGGDYSSLSAWEAAKQGNLVSLDQVQVAECYVGSDTTRVTIDGSTTDATRYMWIKPASGAEAQVPYNTSTAYRLEPASGTDAEMIISDEYTVVERIQVKALKDSGSSPNDGAIFIITLSGGTITVKGCTILGSFGVGNADGSKGIVIADSDPTYHIRNNFIIDYNRTSMRAFDSTNGSGATVNLFNNTAVNCVGGFYSGGTGVLAKNNGYYSNGLGSADGFNGSFNASSDYNASDVASDAPGSNSKNSVTPTFVDSAGGNWHLASSDTAWKDSGTDLSGTFTDDFDAATRSGTWDIGADEYTSAGGSTYQLTGTAACAATVSASVRVIRVMGGVSAAGVATTSASGRTIRTLGTATAAGRATVSATDSVQRGMGTTTAAGAGTASASISTRRALGPVSAAGVASVSASGGGTTRTLTATAAGAAVVSASVFRIRSITATAAGAATVTASIAKLVPRTATAAGAATASASIRTVRSCAAQADGVATTTAAINVVRAFGATVTGRATVTARVSVPTAATAVTGKYAREHAAAYRMVKAAEEASYAREHAAALRAVRGAGV